MVKTKYLDNGICVVGEENDFVRTVSIGIWIKNGSIDEIKENNGISHFIEHMMFKGTNKRTSRDIADEMAEVGGRINAFTAKEFMCYYAHVLENHFDVALDILSDMVCDSKFSEVEMEKEKGVIIEEINMCEDSPEDIVHDLLEEGTWQKASLGYNILGTEDNVRGFTRADLLAYIEKHYVSDNMVISVVGRIDFDTVVEQLNEKFKTIQKREPIPRIKEMEYHTAFLTKHKDIEQTHICLGFPCISYSSDKVYVLTVLNTILGGGLNSRLFQSIREEKGLAYSIYSYPETYKDCGLFIIYAATNPNLIEEVTVSILEELEKILKEGIDEKELTRTKEQIKSNLIIGLESMNSRMSNYGKNMLTLAHIKSQDEIIDKINEVTEESLLSFAKDLIDLNKMSVSIVGNFEEFSIERIREICKR